MKKTIALTLSFSLLALSMASHAGEDVIRERMGLETLEAQLGKILEHSDVLKTYADQDAKRKFNYQMFDSEIKRLQNAIGAHLDHAPAPRGIDVFEQE